LRFKKHIKSNSLDRVYSVGLKKKKMLLAYLHSRKYISKKPLHLRVNEEHFKEINPVDKIM
jgi:excinuclease UvrABC nuclease subunit